MVESFDLGFDASFGDGASFTSIDQGSAPETYWQQGLNDGIITGAQNVGAYRCQQLGSLSGKLIRIDPITGNGLPSNPYYQSGNPGSVQSKIWAIGLRNPCRMSLQPETGSHNPDDGDPGILFIGDVGRPDLAQKATGLTQEDLAGWLFDSLRNKIMVLPDDVLVYPAHGAGSACGKNMSSETFDTLGNQKKTNYALDTNMSKDQFIKELTSGLTPPPQYFEKMHP